MQSFGKHNNTNQKMHNFTGKAIISSSKTYCELKYNLANKLSLLGLFIYKFQFIFVLVFVLAVAD